MELRHLRYFVAVAEAGSFTQAAEHRLHTAQPSLSRQIRDLEVDLGAQLIIRGPRGMQLTPAGRVFLDHARVILLQVETAREAVRRAAPTGQTPVRRRLPDRLRAGVAAANSGDIERVSTNHRTDDPQRRIPRPHAGAAEWQHGRGPASARTTQQLAWCFATVAEEALFVLLPYRSWPGVGQFHSAR